MICYHAGYKYQLAEDYAIKVNVRPAGFIYTEKELRRICREDGMSSIRAWWVYRGVRIGAGPAAARAERAVLIAP